MVINAGDFITKKWSVGGGLKFFEEIMTFIHFMEDFYGIGGNLIDSVFDSHTGLKWNGGRYVNHFTFSLEESIRRIKAYNNIGIRFNITFSNNQLNDGDLTDSDCNWFLNECENSLNAVIVSSHLLKDHIRNQYPAYKIIASIGFNRRDLQFYKEIENEYDMVVLNPDLNRDTGLIKQLNLSKVEILVNELCVENCEFRTEHSTLISKINRENITYFKSDNSFMNGSCIASRHGSKFNSALMLFIL